jgi:hypothetical protein
MRDSLVILTWLISSRTRDDYRDTPYGLIDRYVRRNSIKQTKDRLLDWHIIETDGKYSACKATAKAYGYKLTKAAFESGVASYQIESQAYRKRLSNKPHNKVSLRRRTLNVGYRKAFNGLGWTSRQRD